MVTIHRNIDWKMILWGLLFCLLFILFWGKIISFFFLWPMLAIGAMLWLTSMKKWWFAIIFLTPLSISLEDLNLGGIGAHVPTEPLLALMTLVFGFQVLLKNPIPKALFRHPITWFIVFYLAWIFIASCFSVRPIVSFKYFASKLWFIFPIFFLGSKMFRDSKSIELFLKLYLWPFLGVVLYTLIHHASYGFAEFTPVKVMQPFFKDHTIQGAIYSMCIPFAFYLFWKEKHMWKWVYAFMTIVFVLGLYFTYSRAAWISMVAGLALFVLLKTKISFKSIIILGMASLALLVVSFGRILQTIERNNTDSSDDFYENVESVTNISTDASNVERLNRWACAIDMWKEKPLMGWGPGTYKFEYAPFQQSRYENILTQNFGLIGNAHSEYLGPLSEFGLPGATIVVLIFFGILLLGIKLSQDKRYLSNRNLILCLTIAFSTYVVHGFLNNFLDTDKAAVLFWGIAIILVNFDLGRVKSIKISPSK